MRSFLATIYTALFIFLCLAANAQKNNFRTLLDSGKAVYKRVIQDEQPDFSRAFDYLQKAVQLNPSSTEARYFLGYTIDKMNSPSGASMDQSSVRMADDASRHFEFILKNEARYSGELLVLDP